MDGRYKEDTTTDQKGRDRVNVIIRTKMIVGPGIVPLEPQIFDIMVISCNGPCRCFRIQFLRLLSFGHYLSRYPGAVLLMLLMFARGSIIYC